MMKADLFEPAVGMIIQDCDKRTTLRRLRITHVDDWFIQATVIRDGNGVSYPHGGKIVRIARERLRPNSTGYRIVEGE